MNDYAEILGALDLLENKHPTLADYEALHGLLVSALWCKLEHHPRHRSNERCTRDAKLSKQLARIRAAHPQWSKTRAIRHLAELNPGGLSPRQLHRLL
jgi:hypothetical protein